MQVVNGILEVEIKMRKASNDNFVGLDLVITNEVIRLDNNSFAFTIQDARLATSSETVKKNKINMLDLLAQ